jgi:hypothetical protein
MKLIRSVPQTIIIVSSSQKNIIITITIMIAPRKTLWSTPDAVIQRIAAALVVDCLTDNTNEVLVDLGCGDGRVLLQLAELYTSYYCDNNNKIFSNDNKNKKRLPFIRFIGIDTDQDRIRYAQESWQKAISSTNETISTIDTNIVECQFHCANAVIDVHLWINDATIVYCYLTPRGMRLVQSLLQQHSQHQVRMVISYMNELPHGAVLYKKERISVQTGTAWPLYFYKLSMQQQPEKGK